MCMNEIVFEQNGKLYLDSSMTQSAFTKSRLSERMSEEGFLAVTNDGSWKITPWTFTGTMLKSSDDDMNSASRALAQTVLFEGDVRGASLQGQPFDGCTLKDIFDSNDTTLISGASAAVCSAIEKIMDDGLKCSGTGAGGIFVSRDCGSIIFLPEDLFETAVTCRGDGVYSEFEGRYVYRTLAGNASLRFTQAVIAYRALTGELPFTQVNTTKRHEDYLDHNFVHLANKVYGIDQSLSFYIDNALMRNPRIEVHSKSPLADKRSFNEKVASQINKDIAKEKNAHEDKNMLRAGMHFPLAALYHELGLTQSGAIPSSGELDKVVRTSSVTQEQFDAATKRVSNSFRKSLQTKRWFRHHRTGLTVSCCIIVALALIIANIWHSKLEEPTTQGLSPEQVVEMMYSSVNNLDVTAGQNCTKGKNPRNLVDSVSNFYVATKSRSAYDTSTTCVPPASWICWSNNGTYTIYGLTQFSIEGVQGSLNFIGPKKATHPKTVTSSDGSPIADGTTTTRHVHFFHLYNESTDQLHVMEHNDTVTLTWSKNRWLVTDLAQDYKDNIVDFKKFISDYKAANDADSGDALTTRAALAATYSWISTPEEVTEAKMKIAAENMFDTN